MEENKQNFSGAFVSPAGISVMVGLTFLAAFFGYFQLAVFLLFTSMLFIISRLWGKASLKNVAVELTNNNYSVFQGKDIPVTFVVKNEKNLPLIWLEIYLPISNKNCVVPDETFTYGEYIGEGNNRFFAYGRKFTWVLWNQELKWETTFKAERRGVYRAEDAIISSGDGFGFYIKQMPYKIKKSPLFVVYPKIVPVDTAMFLKRRFDSSEGGRGLYEDKTLLKSSRDYQIGDSVKKINWRMAARQEKLQVNIYETIKPSSIFFVLDIESFSKIVVKEETMEIFRFSYTKELEEGISLIASLALKLSESNMICGLSIPEIAKKESVLVMPQKENYQLLFALASVEYGGEKGVLDEAWLFAHKETLGQIYVVTKNISSFTLKRFADVLQHNITIISVEKEDKKTMESVIFAEDLKGRVAV